MNRSVSKESNIKLVQSVYNDTDLPSIQRSRRKNLSLDFSTRVSNSQFTTARTSEAKPRFVPKFKDEQVRQFIHNQITQRIQTGNSNELVKMIQDDKGQVNKGQINYVRRIMLQNMKMNDRQHKVVKLLDKLQAMPDKVLSQDTIRQMYDIELENNTNLESSHQRSRSVQIQNIKLRGSFVSISPYIQESIQQDSSYMNRSSSQKSIITEDKVGHNNSHSSEYKKISKPVFNFLTKKTEGYDKLIYEIHFAKSKAKDIITNIMHIKNRHQTESYTQEQEQKQLKQEKIKKIVQGLKQQRSRSQKSRVDCLHIIGLNEDKTLENLDISKGIKKIELKDKNVLILTHNHKLYQLSQKPSPIKKSFQLTKLDFIEKYKINNFTNQTDEYLNFSDKYGMLYRYHWKERNIHRIPNISLMNSEFIQMGSTQDRVIGLNSEYRAKYMDPHNKEYPHLIFYELKIISYLKKIQIKQISCGSRHNLMLTLEGRLISHGNGEFGQLGTENFENHYEYPVFPSFFKNLQLSEICAFRETSMVMTVEGLVFTFGCGFEGQIGNKKIENQRIPYCIQKELDVIAKRIKGNDFTASMITDQNQIYVWGLFQVKDKPLPQTKDKNKKQEYMNAIKSKPLNITNLISKRCKNKQILNEGNEFDFEINDDLILIYQFSQQ